MLLTDFIPDAILNGGFQSESAANQDFTTKMKNYWSRFTAYAQTTQGMIVISTIGGIILLALLLKVRNFSFEKL